MVNRPKPTQLQYHEAFDRSSIILETIDRHLIQHNVCKLDKEIAKLIEESAAKMHEAYQLMEDRLKVSCDI